MTNVPEHQRAWLRNSLKAARDDLNRMAERARRQGRRSPSVAEACAVLVRTYEIAADTFATVLAQHTDPKVPTEADE